MATTQSPGKRRRTASEPTKRGARNSGSTSGPQLDTESLVEFYRKMVEIRLFEDAAGGGFRKGQVGGYLHVYTGQEPIATGFIDTFEEGDRVITAYRDHAHVLLMGADPKATMAELYGKGTGIVKGKGGSMHLFDTKNGMYGGYGIVGGHIPLGVGMAFGLAYRGKKNVVQLYLGDGAIHNGAFHEAANLAGVWGRDGLCPCLFIVENNQYGMGTSVERATLNTDLASKFDSYGIENEQVDGMDLEAVLKVAHKAVERVRETGKPYAVEALTYRIVPHGAADFLEKYRTKEEVRKWRERDPIGLLERRLLEAGVDEARLQEIKSNAKTLAEECVKYAEESPEPSIDELTTDVYASGLPVAKAG
ncbi:MAG: thiamine pyrophosphate-dependent enzyme [Thermomicrobiales bacterium]